MVTEIVAAARRLDSDKECTYACDSCIQQCTDSQQSKQQETDALHSDRMLEEK